jgi:DNA-3-methyladenine glycosylase
MPERLEREALAAPALEVAPALVGQVLVRALPGGRRLAARIVEVEAYEQDDPASHAHRGPTDRNHTMFGPPGHLYVYFTYGMHWCMNVVTGPAGQGCAVLLRAGEPLEGIDEMRRRRPGRPVRELCAGPARWTRAFGVDGRLDGADVIDGREIWLERGPGASRVVAAPRVGIRRAADRPWRFLDPGSPALSRPAPPLREPTAQAARRRPPRLGPDATAAR